MGYIEKIRNSALQSAELTQKLLTFSKDGGVLRNPLRLHNLIEEAAALLKNEDADKHNIEISLRFDAPYDTIHGDSPQILHTILALGINAQEAMPRGGRLSITTLTPEAGSLPPGLNSGKYIRADFLDTGEGMSPEVLERVFEPFFTTKEPRPGRGMSLPAVYGLMQAHGGTVTAHSEPGEGSRFSIFFPLAAGN